MTFVAGQKLRASELNDISERPLAVLTAGADTTTTTGVWTSVAMSTEVIDTHSGHSTTTNNSRWTCPSGQNGYYYVSGSTHHKGGASGTVRAVRIAKNNTSVDHTQANIPTLDTVSMTTNPTVLLLAVGDYIELQAFQNSGANRSTLASQTVLMIKWERAA